MLTKHQITHPSPAISADPIAPLEAALIAAKGNDVLYRRLRTELEQAAGRKAIEEGNRDKQAYDGKTELQRRFGERAVLSASWELRRTGIDDVGEYWVDVLIQPADGGDVMCFTEYLDEFPSDECIANIALVA
jgi:hypothetical protein